MLLVSIGNWLDNPCFDSALSSCQLPVIRSSKSQIRAHIEDALSVSDGVIIQVGSNDGVSNYPLYEPILLHKRQSYLVEPIDYLAQKLRSLHKLNPYVQVCQFAIHPTSTSVDFFCLPKDADIKLGDLWKP